MQANVFVNLAAALRATALENPLAACIDRSARQALPVTISCLGVGFHSRNGPLLSFL